MTMSLPTLAPSAAPASPTREAAPAALVPGEPAALAPSAATPANAGNFELALQAAQWRDDLAPAPALPAMPQTDALPADAQSSADEARDALAAALLTPIVSVPVSAPTAQVPHISATDLDDEAPVTEPTPAPAPATAPGLQLNATLLETAQRAEPVRSLMDTVTSGTRAEPADAGLAHASALAFKPGARSDGIAAVIDRHTEVDLSAPAAGTPTSWRHVLSAELDTSGSSIAPLKLPASTPSQWREPLLNTLGERVQWHIQRGSEQAVIRLDPPNLGRVDIVIKQEGGLMQVHMSATHRDVVQQLQGLSDHLRQELAVRQSGEVAVLVSDQSRDGDARQRGRQASPDDDKSRPGRALSESGDTDTSLRAFSLQTQDR